jgi:hypothetical protein
MATNIFKGLVDRAKSFGLFGVNADAAKKWFRMQASQYRNVNVSAMMRSDPKRLLKTNQVGPETMGKMVMFFYDPKHKKTLPYYDRVPLIFPVEPAKGGFYGINLHYLSPYHRAKLFDVLTLERMKNKGTEKQKLVITYKILKGASQYRAFKPCFKHYLYSQLQSRFFVVAPEEWDTVLFLPIARFERGGGKLDGVPGQVGGTISKTRIYADSQRKING